MSDDQEGEFAKLRRRKFTSTTHTMSVDEIIANMKPKEQTKLEDLEKLTRLKDLVLPRGCEAFEAKTVGQGAQELIRRANQIIEEFRDRGFTLTLRQLYYQFVSRNWLLNHQSQYTRLGKAVGIGRIQGLIPWNSIEDRTRHRRELSEDSNTNFDGIMRRKLSYLGWGYKENLWDSQKYRPEVWVEKDALIEVVGEGCTHGVPSFSTRGFCSDTLIYAAAKKFSSYLDRGLIPVILHLADCDPSGQAMTEDIRDKLWTFTRCGNVEVRRIGLHKEQALQYGLPPNLIKTDEDGKDKDSRATDYRFDHGDECWELDALDPDVIIRLIEDELGKVIDKEAWKEAEENEAKNSASLIKTGEIIKHYRESIIWFARRKRFEEVAARWDALKGEVA